MFRVRATRFFPSRNSSTSRFRSYRGSIRRKCSAKSPLLDSSPTVDTHGERSSYTKAALSDIPESGAAGCGRDIWAGAGIADVLGGGPWLQVVGGLKLAVPALGLLGAGPVAFQYLDVASPFAGAQPAAGDGEFFGGGAGDAI